MEKYFEKILVLLKKYIYDRSYTLRGVSDMSYRA